MLAVGVIFSSDSLLKKILSTGQNEKMLNQCFTMLFSGQKPNFLRHNEQAMTNVLNTATLILIGRPTFCKLYTSNSTVNLLSGIVNKRPVLRHQNTLILGSRQTVRY